MTDEVFLDSNVLLYACSSAPEDAAKRRVAEGIILSRRFGDEGASPWPLLFDVGGFGSGVIVVAVENRAGGA